MFCSGCAAPGLAPLSLQAGRQCWQGPRAAASPSSLPTRHVVCRHCELKALGGPAGRGSAAGEERGRQVVKGRHAAASTQGALERIRRFRPRASLAVGRQEHARVQRQHVKRRAQQAVGLGKARHRAAQPGRGAGGALAGGRRAGAGWGCAGWALPQAAPSKYASPQTAQVALEKVDARLGHGSVDQAQRPARRRRAGATRRRRCSPANACARPTAAQAHCWPLCTSEPTTKTRALREQSICRGRRRR